MSRLWYALRLASTTDPVDPVTAWALQFTPRVARVEEAVALEVSASVRLFGGAAALRARLVREAGAFEQACGLGQAPTSLAALALARAGGPRTTPRTISTPPRSTCAPGSTRCRWRP